MYYDMIKYDDMKLYYTIIRTIWLKGCTLTWEEESSHISLLEKAVFSCVLVLIKTVINSVI